MSLGVVMRDVRQVFARDAHVVGVVVVANRQDNVARFVYSLSGLSLKFPGAVPVNADDFFVLVNIELECPYNLAIVLQGFVAGRLLTLRDKRNAADLQKLRCGEKNHLSREMKNGIRDAALFQDDISQSVSLAFDCRRESRRTPAHDDGIKQFLTHASK